MKHQPSILFAIGLLLIASSTSILAQETSTLDVPRTISYQGILTSPGGSAVPDGTYEVSVGLYADPLGHTLIWTDTYNTLVHNGIFNIYLGTGTSPLPPASEMNRPMWIGTSVNGSDVMLPLTPLTASPYALNLPDQTVTANKLADGSVTAAKISAPYLSGLEINGQQIKEPGGILKLQSGENISLTYDEITGAVLVGQKSSQQDRNLDQKGSSTLASSTKLWSIDGDAYDVSGAGSAYIPTNTDWIGTNTNVNFTIKVNGGGVATGGYQRVMQYVPHTTSANILGGHNSNSIGSGGGNVIAGGGQYSSANAIVSTSKFNFIGSGIYNRITGDYSVLNGGRNNEIEGNYSVLGGGGGEFTDNFGRQSPEYDINSIKSKYGVVGGGRGNWIRIDADDATIGGGVGNTIEASSYSDPSHPDESGGTIAGGGNNKVKGYYGVITGGHHNLVEGTLAFIGGGGRLSHDPPMGSSDPHAIANKAIGDWSVVVGGSDNQALSDYSFIGGGDGNYVENATGGVIVGGDNNVFSSTTYSENANYSFIGAGTDHRMKALKSVIVGGLDNEVVNLQPVGATNPAHYSGIVAGHQNRIWTQGSGIVAGWSNQVSEEALYGFIGAGRTNTISKRAEASTIAGGQSNVISTDAQYAAIGGGAINEIIAPPPASGTGEIRSMATIPGGDGLIAQSWAQTVLGGWNIAKGSVPFRFDNGTSTDREDPILIIGNGTSAQNRSNAFEVSYNGHSIVYDLNGTGATNSAIRGGTYTDNVIYAWGNAIPSPGSVAVTCDFGVAQIIYNSPGNYTVTLNLVKPDGTAMNIDCGSATATLLSTSPEEFACGIINTTPVSGNTFNVYIRKIDCTTPDDLPFTFKVTGRPQ